MIIVAGTVVVRPEMREAAIERGLWMSRLTEQEPGCRSYHFYADIADPATFLLFEEWESDEALRATSGRCTCRVQRRAVGIGGKPTARDALRSHRGGDTLTRGFGWSDEQELRQDGSGEWW